MRQEQARALVRPATANDLDSITRIYNHYILNTIITFEEQPVSRTEMAGRMEGIASASLPWLVAEQHGEVLGYAYAGRWKSRYGYRFSVESTVYLDPAAMGKGLGGTLYGNLLKILRDEKFHVAIGGIALPNPASVALHEKLGFRKVAHYREIGFKFDQWIDVGYWQLSL
jgi:phosphinothricin acetyltransferase